MARGAIENRASGIWKQKRGQTDLQMSLEEVKLPWLRHVEAVGRVQYFEVKRRCSNGLLI